MLDCMIYTGAKLKKAMLKVFFRVVCNFIPNKHLRVKTRNAFYEKYCRLPPIQDKVILLNEVDKHLPKAVLTQINAYDNEHFIKQNAQILPNFKETNANLRQNLPNSHKITMGKRDYQFFRNAYKKIILALFLALPNTAFAYLDPASGSLLLSSIVAIFASIIFILKNIFYKFGSLGAAFLNFLTNFNSNPINSNNLTKSNSKFFKKGKNSITNTSNLNPQNLVFYCEGRQYYHTFKSILDILDSLKYPYTYFTSDEYDPVFKRENFPQNIYEFIGFGNKAYTRLNFLKADIFMLTTPGLNVLHIKRSRGVKHYAHIVHSLTPMTYHSFGIDYFDSVFLTNEVQAKFVREVENAHQVPEKSLFVVGSTYLDEYAKLYEKIPSTKHITPTILISPSWGKESLLMKFGEKLLLAVAQTPYNVIVRPHPQSLISPSESANITLLKERLKDFKNISWDIGTPNIYAFLKADLLIGDFSSVIFDFVCLAKKPILTLDFNFDVAGYDVADIDLKNFYTFKTLKRIGIKLKESDFKDIKNIIDRALNSGEFKANLECVANELWENRKNSAKSCVSALLQIEKAILEQKLGAFMDEFSRLKTIDDMVLSLNKDNK